MSTEIARPPGPLAKFLGRLDLPLLGPPLPTHLPDRVARAIREQESRSEVLISAVQFGAVVFFAAFYFLSPRAYFAKTAFEPVPWMLAAYALFTLLRYRLASRGLMDDTLTRLSIVADIAILMLTIWSFHIQYQQRRRCT
jgi:adenylate cyclase